MRHIAASAEAIAAIERKLDAAAGNPKFVNLVPVLFVAFGQVHRHGGRIVARHSGVGWSPKGILGAAKAEFMEVSLGQFIIIADVRALKLLSGKRLEIETVEIGVPTPSDVKADFLVAQSR